MAAVTKNDIPHISNFMSDFWNLTKQFWIPETNDEYWQKLSDAVEEIAKKYNRDEYVVGQLLQYVDYLNKKVKGNGKL